MPEEQFKNESIEQQLVDFQKQNPKVAQAMELFGMSLKKYQETLLALYGPQIYQSTSTAQIEKSNQ